MADQEVGKTAEASGGSSNQTLVSKAKGWAIPILRLVAFFATVSATVVMATNKDTQSFVIATIGSTPVKLTLTAKFQHTPAFVFFVIANGLASFHNLLMLAVNFIGHKYDYKGYKGLRFLIVAILDMMIVALVAGGATAAAFMGELGRNGNSHARWNKICDKFDKFCDHGSGAMLASFIGLLLLMIINILSIIKLSNPNIAKNSVAGP